MPSLDTTGFTLTTMSDGELRSLLRILDAQKVCAGPAGAQCRADTIFRPRHRRIELFNASEFAADDARECGIGIGFGDDLAVGPNLSQGTEMVQALKLGEDIARAKEVLVTERAFEALDHRSDVAFDEQKFDDQLFPFYQATEKV